jgi:3D (Asp-Asp-Asp) domain-containing protein
MLKLKPAMWLIGILTFLLSMCADEKAEQKTMEVTATAYNSLRNQTSGNPNITAWGDTLKPGIKAIAVSRDLIDSGLVYQTDVKIEGLAGTYVVLDKMNRRWTKKIDIYMGNSVQKAREWGRQEVTIRWTPQTAE